MQFKISHGGPLYNHAAVRDTDNQMAAGKMRASDKGLIGLGIGFNFNTNTVLQQNLIQASTLNG